MNLSNSLPSRLFAQADQNPAVANSVKFTSTLQERENALYKGLGEIPGVRYQTTVTVNDSRRVLREFFPCVSFTRRAVVWDSEKKGFVYRHETFLQYVEEGAWKRSVVASGEVPMGVNSMDEKGIFVDGDNQCLILPDGRYIDGPTGRLYTLHGEPMIPKKGTEKDC